MGYYTLLLLLFSWKIYNVYKAVGTFFGLGGKHFLILHLHIKRIQFCSLVYLWFPKFTELSVYFILIYIHLFICHYFLTLNFFGWQNIVGGGQLPPPLFLRPCIHSTQTVHHTTRPFTLTYSYLMPLVGRVMAVWPYSQCTLRDRHSYASLHRHACVSVGVWQCSPTV